MVKATRPMTYQFLTVSMIKSIREDGIIDQTTFKTKERYGFDSLIFSSDVLDIINGYIACIRSRLNPQCDFLLISKNGTQLCRLTDIFGRLVYQAIGKYINPTRFRQIIETESAERLTVDEQQVISEDQKHTSTVAKVHYQKVLSRTVAEKAMVSMDKLRDQTQSVQAIQEINAQVKIPNGSEVIPTKIIPEDRIVKFSEIEDQYLAEGLRKHGYKWKSILHDQNYKFHPSRKTSTLLNRAKLKKLIN